MARKLYNTSLRNLTYRLRAFKDNLPSLLEKVIRDKESEIISAITNDQLYEQGITGFGVKIADYRPYVQSTKRRKMRKGQPIDRVTLHDTGNFYKSLFITFTKDGFYIDSNDEAAEWLLKKYGEEILRLTNENLNNILRNHIRVELVKQIKQAIKK